MIRLKETPKALRLLLGDSNKDWTIVIHRRYTVAYKEGLRLTIGNRALDRLKEAQKPSRDARHVLPKGLYNE